MVWLEESYHAVASSLGMKLKRHALKNEQKWAYYYGRASIKNIGIAVPESLVNVEAVIGWPEVVVDALAERLEWQGWRSASDIEGLDSVFAQNQLGLEVQKAIQDALVTGVGFLAVSKGAVGEPDVVVNAVPSTSATYEWDDRTNRMACGLVSQYDGDGVLWETLYLPDETVTRIVRDGVEEVSVDRHRLGRCALVALTNRSRAGVSRGRSELTRAIRYYTDHGVRTMLGMEYNREFYTTPQRYLTNVTPEQLGASEEPTAQELVELGWKVAMNKALVIPPADDDYPGSDSNPQAGQFSAASPAPYIDELRMLAQLVSAQSGVPASYLGFVSDNPASADAIRASESRLVKKAEDRQRAFGLALVDLAWLCVAALEGRAPGAGFVADVSPMWREASTPTLAATMDAMVKGVQAKIFPEYSEVILDKLGLSEAEKQVIRRESAQQRSVERLEMMVAASRSGVSVPAVDGAVGLDEFVAGGDSSGV